MPTLHEDYAAKCVIISWVFGKKKEKVATKDKGVHGCLNSKQGYYGLLNIKHGW